MRHVLLLQMEEERAQFQQERSRRTQDLQEQHNTQLQEFDLHSASMGLDAMHIAEATKNTFDQEYDVESVRGSVLSLTPSTSSSSFTHSHTAL